MYRLMLEAGAEERDLKSVRLWAAGADAMPTELAERFKKMGATASLPVVGDIGEAMFAEGYGLVEVGGGVGLEVLGDQAGLELEHLVTRAGLFAGEVHREAAGFVRAQRERGHLAAGSHLERVAQEPGQRLVTGLGDQVIQGAFTRRHRFGALQ